MATALSIPPASTTEDSASRFFSRDRGLIRRLVKKTYTLIDGTNSGNTVDYVAEEVSLAAGTTVALTTPAGTDVTASATGAASIATATLPAVAAKTTFITGFEVTGLGATAAAGVTVTVTGTISGTLSYVLAVPAGATVGATPLIVSFSRPVPSSAVNTAITVTVPSFGAGNTNTAVVAHGYTV